jgi:hypothetical protein
MRGGVGDSLFDLGFDGIKAPSQFCIEPFNAFQKFHIDFFVGFFLMEAHFFQAPEFE